MAIYSHKEGRYLPKRNEKSNNLWHHSWSNNSNNILCATYSHVTILAENEMNDYTQLIGSSDEVNQNVDLIILWN